MTPVEASSSLTRCLIKQNSPESINLKNQLPVILDFAYLSPVSKATICILFLVFTDGGVRWHPAKYPSHCQHPGHWRKWQYAHVCRGLLQHWGLHRHAAGGDGATGNQSNHRSLSFRLVLRRSAFTPPSLCDSVTHTHTHSFVSEINNRNDPAPNYSSLGLICSRDRGVRVFLSRSIMLRHWRRFTQQNSCSHDWTNCGFLFCQGWTFISLYLLD